MRAELTLAMKSDRDERNQVKMPRSVVVTHGDMLCEVRFWNEAEWASLPIAKRPRERMHKPGSGWIGLVPIAAIGRG